LLCEIGDGQWNIPGLRAQLEKIAPDDAVLEDYEVEHAFPEIGHRIMLLNARKVFYEDNGHTTLLLAIDDVTERRAADRVLQQLLRQKELLLAEMQHRVANSLQIIASILLLKASTVQSEETRLHLHDAHKRVISVAAAQQHLLASPRGDPIAIGPYLSKLCETLAQSMIGEGRGVAMEVVAKEGTVSSGDAVSIGLIVTEGVINALKYAFPSDKHDARIVVAYDIDGQNWTLSIADNGIGSANGSPVAGKAGLGTTIINVLAEQLVARVSVTSGPSGGTILAVAHAIVDCGDVRSPQAETF
jgi:chemotaxis protein methyltransferase CheR